jgi:exosome complex component MTR3
MFVKSAEERELASLLAEALSVAIRLDRYPKSHIDLFVTILQADGGSWLCSVIAHRL